MSEQPQMGRGHTLTRAGGHGSPGSARVPMKASQESTAKALMLLEQWASYPSLFMAPP